MLRMVITFTIGTLFGIGGMHAARESGSIVTPLSSREIAETLDGEKAAATAVEVRLEPGGAGMPHRHPGPVFGYVLEGEYELGIDEQPTNILRAGETFYEPTGCLHRVSRNPSKEHVTRVIAWVLHPRDVKNLVLPAHE